MELVEETQSDERNGRVTNPSLAEYHVPVHLDVPAIDVVRTDVADPHTPMGARGIGEISIAGVGGAVAHAVFNATGKRVRDLPITLDTLKQWRGPPLIPTSITTPHVRNCSSNQVREGCLGSTRIHTASPAICPSWGPCAAVTASASRARPSKS